MKGNFTLLPLSHKNCQGHPIFMVPNTSTFHSCGESVQVSNIYTHSHGQLPVFSVAFTEILFLFPAFSFTTPVPHPSRAPEQFHSPTWIKTSAGEAKNKSQCTQDSKIVTGPCDASTQVHELLKPPKKPSTQDQDLLKPWANDLGL